MRCAWPKSCDEVPLVAIGLLVYCQDHAIEVEKTRHTIILEHHSYKPATARHLKWVKAQAEAKRKQPPEEKKKVDTLAGFREGIARHDKWRADNVLSPEQKAS